MASQTDILNFAVQLLSGFSTASIDDATPEARALRLCYDTIRQAELRKHPWNFAKKRAVVAASASAPAFGYAYQCPLPADCLRLLNIENVETYEVASGGDGERVVLSDSDTLYVTYVADVTDTARFDALFVPLFGCALALQVARSLTDGGSLVDRIASFYADYAVQAKTVDAQEDPPQDLPDGTWVKARA